MILSWIRLVPVVVLVCGCASMQPALNGDRSGENALEASGISYAGVYQDDSGIRVFDESRGFDSLLIPRIKLLYLKELSPRRDKLALSYWRDDAYELSILNLRSFRLASVNLQKRDPKHYGMSMTWKHDNSTLFFGFHSERKSGQQYILDKSYLYCLLADSMSVKPIAANVRGVIEGWLSSGFLVLRGSDRHYLVDPESGKIAFILAGKKANLTYSPNAKKCFYFHDVEVVTHDGRNVRVPELYVADYDGKNPKKVSDYRYRPERASWSPDSKMITYVAQSQQWSNIKHLVFYEVESSKTTFAIQLNEPGIRSITDPHWSPSGRYVVFDRTADTGDERDFWSASEKVVRDMSTGEELTVSSGFINLKYVEQSIPAGATLGWFDDENIAFATTNWVRVFNLPTNKLTTFSSSWMPLHLWQAK